MKKIIVIFSLLICTLNMNAVKEKIITVKGVKGEYSVVMQYADVTGREAFRLAEENAKRKALEKVCGSHITVWEQMEMSFAAGESYNSLSINQIDGEIVEFDVIEKNTYQSPIFPEETVFYCIANVKVKKGLAPDPDFTASVGGLKSVYYVGESLNFDITPYRNCYLKVFLMEDDKTGYMLYPNLWDASKEIPADSRLLIPESNYSLKLRKSKDQPKEINRLVFVFTKTERPFNHKVTSRSEIEEWIAMIPNDQKYLHFFIIEIRDK